MSLLKALSEFPVKRLSRLTLPNNVALLDACKHFDFKPKCLEETNSRISRIVSAFNNGKAASVAGHDVRFIVATIGSSTLIGREEVPGIVAEIERRNFVLYCVPLRTGTLLICLLPRNVSVNTQEFWKATLN